MTRALVFHSVPDEQANSVRGGRETPDFNYVRLKCSNLIPFLILSGRVASDERRIEMDAPR